MLAAFSMFFMQCQSFWEHQRQMQSRSGKDNAQSLFGLEKIPSDQQIRNILDLITANSLNSVFEKVYQFLQLGKHLKSYERLCGAVTVWTNPLALIALDPTHSIMEKREWIIGKSYESRILVVVFTMREEAIRIISARPASKSEKKKYAESN